MEIISVGEIEDNILITVSVPKAPLRVLFAIPDGGNLPAMDLSTDQIRQLLSDTQA